jgi:2,3-bisphosphoglycerate-independent phosphoglycerate mutase
MKIRSPVLLCILDGLGLNPNPKGNAVALAKKPTLDRLFATAPWTTLITNGTRVGLPDEQMGNSEVGHLNIGAGRVVEQWLYRITRDLPKVISQSKLNDSKPVHLIGLFSRGGVHSDLAHMLTICRELLSRGAKSISLHLILDGRDTAPTVAASDVKALLPFLKENPSVKIASISGRFFAMDRDKRWERTESAYKCIALGISPTITNPVEYIESSYGRGITDEFIEPVSLSQKSIDKDATIIFFNFRADRMRQIVSAFGEHNFAGFKREFPAFSADQILCMTQYDESFKFPYLFQALPVNNHLGEVVSKAGLTQLRTAETEKYPHVTYFLNGLLEEPLAGETRRMEPSPRDVKTYDQKPEMSALGVEKIVIEGINSDAYDLIVVNFANCDMVGHTGVLNAAIKAVETVDGCLGRVLEALQKKGGQALIIADHGNAEQMIDYQTGTPHTAHTTFPVPAILVGGGEKVRLRENGALCDVAPTILTMLNIQQPREMTGTSLF